MATQITLSTGETVDVAENPKEVEERFEPLDVQSDQMYDLHKFTRANSEEPVYVNKAHVVSFGEPPSGAPTFEAL